MSTAAADTPVFRYYSQFDLAVHHPPSADALRNLDESQTFRDLHEQFYFVRPPEPFHRQTDFSHLVSGYDAGYYVYMLYVIFPVVLRDSAGFASAEIPKNIWLHGLMVISSFRANVFAQDMFHVNFGPDHRSIAAWDRYRREIMGYGGSRDEKQVLESFLGRAPNEDALLKSLGLSPATDDRAE